MKRFFCAHWISWFGILIIALISLVIDILVFQDNQSYIVLLVCILIEIIALGYLCYYTFFTYIYIGAEGVTFKSLFSVYYLKWADIKEIGIGEYSRIRGNTLSKIYFSTYKVSPHFLNDYKISDEFIVVDYRPNIMKEIKKHWSGAIYGLPRNDQ